MFELQQVKQEHNEENSQNKLKTFLIKDDGTRTKPKFTKRGEWTLKQMSKYAAFIFKNSSDFENKPIKCLWDKFKEMSKFVESRNYRQCKIYHQRKYNEFKNIPNIINQFCYKFPKFSLQLQQEKQFLAAKVNEKDKKLQNKCHSQTIMKIADKNLYPTATSYQPQVSSPYSDFMKKIQNNYLPSRTMVNWIPPINHEMQRRQTNWRECHQYFLKWIQKYNSIMISSQTSF